MLHSTLSAQDLEREREIVSNELDILESKPVRVLAGRMQAVSYPQHGYGRPVEGYRSDLERITAEGLRAFWRRHYRPDNALLVVAGKFSVNETLSDIASTLGQIAKFAPATPQAYTHEPAQDGERSVIVRRPAPTQVVLVSYRTPPPLHPDAEPLAVLARVIGDEPRGRLHQALVTTKMVQGGLCVLPMLRDAGKLMVGIVFAPDDDVGERKRVLLETLEDITRHPITEYEFQQARDDLLQEYERRFANVASVANVAIRKEAAGDWRAVFVNRDRMKAVTLDDVNRVARTYLVPDNRTLGHLIPTSEPKRAPPLEPADPKAYMMGFSLRPEGAGSFAFDYSPRSLYDKVHYSAGAGPKISTLEKSVRDGLVRGVLKLKLGNLSALLHQDAAATLAIHMLGRGTSRLTRKQIIDKLTRLGASVDFDFDMTGGTMTVVARVENFKQALELGMHMLKEPSMPEPEFEEERSALIKQLQGELQDRTAQNRSAWQRYGNPYGPNDFRYQLTSEEMLDRYRLVTVGEAREFHRRFFGAEHAAFVLLGPVDATPYEQWIREQLGAWHQHEAYQRVPYPLNEPPPARLVFDEPGQASVRLRGYQNIPISSNGMERDYYALGLAVQILGGGTGSRLWNKMREQEGLTYDVGVTLEAGRYDVSGNVSVNAVVAPKNTSRAETILREELANSLATGFTDAEVESFRRRLLEDRKRRRSGDRWALTYMMDRMEDDLQQDAYEQRDKVIDSLRLEEINATWRKFVNPEKFVWGIFGDQSKVR